MLKPLREPAQIKPPRNKKSEKARLRPFSHFVSEAAVQTAFKPPSGISR